MIEVLEQLGQQRLAPVGCHPGSLRAHAWSKLPRRGSISAGLIPPSSGLIAPLVPVYHKYMNKVYIITYADTASPNPAVQAMPAPLCDGVLPGARALWPVAEREGERGEGPR
ncbi:MAG: hypothetical protein U1E17_08335 [Geminicoccaceae bacterium]